MDALLEILIPFLMIIESSGDPNAIGDKGASVGILQIKVITVRDVNRIVGKNVYSPADRRDTKKAVAMCRIYLAHYGRKIMKQPIPARQKLVLLARIWNGGPRGYKKKATLGYAQKVLKLLPAKITAKKKGSSLSGRWAGPAGAL